MFDIGPLPAPTSQLHRKSVKSLTPLSKGTGNSYEGLEVLPSGNLHSKRLLPRLPFGRSLSSDVRLRQFPIFGRKEIGHQTPAAEIVLRIRVRSEDAKTAALPAPPLRLPLHRMVCTGTCAIQGKHAESCSLDALILRNGGGPARASRFWYPCARQ